MTEVADMPRVACDSADPIWPPLDRRAIRVMARARLNSEVRLIVLDLLGPCEPDELPVEMSAWIENVAANAVIAVCDTSMRALFQSLESTIAGAPRNVLHRLDEAAARHDAGIA